MSVKIELDGTGTATVDDRKWIASNRIMRDMLVGIDEERMYDEVGYHPFPDMGIAELAVKVLGAKIIEVKDAPKFVVGRIY